MAIETDADRLAYLTTFGETVNVDGVALRGLLDDEYRAVQIGDQVVESNFPVLVVRTSDVPTVVRGALVTVAGVDYRIREIQPDGVGLTTLVLKEGA